MTTADPHGRPLGSDIIAANSKEEVAFLFFGGGPDTRMVKNMGLLGISTGNRDFMEEMVV